MAKKTNKTAHLLNTLTSGTTEAEEAKESQGASPENKVIVVNETSENEKLSNEIKNRLEAQLEEEMAGTAASGEAQEPAAAVDRTLSAEPAEEEKTASQPAAPASSGDTPASAAPPAPAASAAPEPPAPAALPAAEEEQKKRAYNLMNVMERLLSDMEGEMESEMRQNGVCMCDRCRADVQALVLTNMPAKYVIVDSSNASPILGYHKNRYKIAMLTEILKACIKVKEAPRH